MADGVGLASSDMLNDGCAGLFWLSDKIDNVTETYAMGKSDTIAEEMEDLRRSRAMLQICEIARVQTTLGLESSKRLHACFRVSRCQVGRRSQSQAGGTYDVTGNQKAVAFKLANGGTLSHVTADKRTSEDRRRQLQTSPDPA